MPLEGHVPFSRSARDKLVGSRQRRMAYSFFSLVQLFPLYFVPAERLYRAQRCEASQLPREYDCLNCSSVSRKRHSAHAPHTDPFLDSSTPLHRTTSIYPLAFPQALRALLESGVKPDSVTDKVNSFISSVGLDQRSCGHRSSVRDSSGVGNRHGGGWVRVSVRMLWVYGPVGPAFALW